MRYWYISEPKKINIDPLQYEVEVQFQYPDGNYMGVRLILVKNSLDEWKIVEETDLDGRRRGIGHPRHRNRGRSR